MVKIALGRPLKLSYPNLDTDSLENQKELQNILLGG